MIRHHLLSMPVGFQGVRLHLALAITVAVAMLVGSAPPEVKAHAARIDCGIFVAMHEAGAIDRFESTGPDFYLDPFKINGQGQKTGDIDNKRHITPHWTREVGIPCDEVFSRGIPIDLGLKDTDWPDNDDRADINPSKSEILYLQVNLANPDSPDIAGNLTDRETGQELGVFRTTDWAYGSNLRWQSGVLVSEGGGTDHDAWIKYEVHVLREPDLRITGIGLADNGGTRVSIVNEGGPGDLRTVYCSNKGRHLERTVNMEMGPGASTAIDLGPIVPQFVRCAIEGNNWFYGPEPHTDNNVLARDKFGSPEYVP